MSDMPNSPESPFDPGSVDMQVSRISRPGGPATVPPRSGSGVPPIGQPQREPGGHGLRNALAIGGGVAIGGLLTGAAIVHNMEGEDNSPPDRPNAQQNNANVSKPGEGILPAGTAVVDNRTGEVLGSATASPESTTIATPEVIERPQATQEVVDYFKEVAGVEYGRNFDTVLKWVEDPKLKVIGNPTENDREYVKEVIDGLNQLIQGIQLQEVEEGENVRVFFGSLEEFKNIIQPGQIAALNDRMLGAYIPQIRSSKEAGGLVIKGADIFISSSLSESSTLDTVWEEIAQSMGLGKDSKDPESIFYGNAIMDLKGPSEKDKGVLSLLYSPAVKPGLKVQDIDTVVDIVQ